MGCPQCQSDELSPSGVCLICGFQTAETQAPAGETTTDAEALTTEAGLPEDAAAEPPREAVPQWRQELSNRLHEIQQKREAQAAKPAPQPKSAPSVNELHERLLQRLAPKKPQPLTPPPRQKVLEPLEPRAESKAAPPAQVRDMIDKAVSRLAPPSDEPRAVYVQEPAMEDEGKLILVSRTLAGLVDLIVITACTGGCMIAADHFAGIVALDPVSLGHMLALFLLIYFLYSLFFLSATNQTIGMMMTDLQVVDARERRPSWQRILGRCCLYLASLFVLGLGLIAGLFDRESRCFHDRTSGTRVIRV